VYEKIDRDDRNWVALGGVLIILTGVISLLDAWIVVSWATWDSLWPLLFIVLGLWIVWNRFKVRPQSL
jgi:hypothetical protein